MPDDIDFSTDRYAEWLEDQITYFRLKNSERPCLPVGKCHNCDEPVPDPYLYCPGEDCQKDHEKRMRYAEINR